MQPNDQFQPQQPTDQPPGDPQTFAPQQPVQAVISPTVTPDAPAPTDYAATNLSVPPPPASVNQPDNAHKGGFMRPAAKALALLLIVGGLAGGGFAVSGGLANYNRDHAKAAAVSYIGFLNNSNDSAAYHASSSNLRNTQSETQFKTSLGDLSAKNPKFSDQQLQVKGDKAVYTATVDGLPTTDTGRTDGVFTIALVKHGLASWQVDSVQVQ